MTTSLKVAEYFGKNHFDVLKAIRNLDCSHGFSASNFAVPPYVDRQGKTKPAYEMTRDGFMFTVMGYRGSILSPWKSLEKMSSNNKIKMQVYK